MSYDEGLLERIRELLEEDASVSEKKMFGGVAFLADGKMFCGLAGEDLMVRVGPEGHEAALARRHARPMDFTGKPMRGYVYVAPEGLSEDDALRAWVMEGRTFVATLPAKGATKSPAKKSPAKTSSAKTSSAKTSSAKTSSAKKSPAKTRSAKPTKTKTTH